MTTRVNTRRAIGIARQSHGDGESVAQQTARIRAACKRDNMRLLVVHEEQDVSGRTPLDKRHGLRQAIEAIEAGQADVIVGAYFDRLMRSLRVQHELVERVEAAGGEVLALDTGQVTNGSAGQWLSGTMLGAVAEYHARTTAERTAESIQAAINRGVPPWPRVTPGYRRLDDGTYEPAETAPAVAEALELRATGATIGAVRALLAERGLRMSYAAVGRLMSNRTLLGEIHYGTFSPNLAAHDPIVDPDVWQVAQRVKPSRGRPAKSDRLLARLGVLRCGTCGARMSASTGHSGTRPLYRCSAHAGDACTYSVSIGAELVEGVVVDAVKVRLAGVRGRASAQSRAHRAQATLDRAQAELDALIAILDPLEPAARDRLAAATAKRDAAREHHDRLAPVAGGLSVSADDWERLSLAEQRGLIRSTIASVRVDRGRGEGRISVELLGEQSGGGLVEDALRS